MFATNNRQRMGVFICMLVMAGSTVILADWQPGDGHKMHWPQTPKPGGWDVEFAMSRLADDWMCSEAGPVTDIHFWVSWMQNMWQPIEVFTISIWSNWPVGHPQNQYEYSVPGVLLWDRDFFAGQFTQLPQPPDTQDWYDPSSGQFGLNDHWLWDQINIDTIPDPFIQQEDSIYWLEIDFWDLPFIGWKETDRNWNDDGVFWYFPDWIELRDPITGGTIDLAFVITGGAVQPDFIRGDADGNGMLSISDGLYCLRCQFVPGWPDSCKCDDATDADDNGVVSIGDCLRILRKQFVPGWQDSIPPPCCDYPDSCGPDPTLDALGCDEHPCMGGVLQR